jgi:hypothetical protein
LWVQAEICELVQVIVHAGHNTALGLLGTFERRF